MNKQQYKRAYHLFRMIQLLEKQIKPNSDNAYEYIWHQIKQMTSEISALDGWCVMEHYEDAQRHDAYVDFWWLWYRFPLYVAHGVEATFMGREMPGYIRQYVHNYLNHDEPVEVD